MRQLRASWVVYGVLPSFARCRPWLIVDRDAAHYMLGLPTGIEVGARRETGLVIGLDADWARTEVLAQMVLEAERFVGDGFER
ncbi:unnamed protein product [Linum tenue]|uniref:Uncharacterized protein n=1 Tax=Linum tenue TaxID=586396 RepID=A0AAV0JTN0_9ROSI|nr:unnamed protein product [Linum tenue]CAI0412213.1 unnamed protein product [Linum tenue]CAI0543696.1 unnamed protein product [Linum tenue]